MNKKSKKFFVLKNFKSQITDQNKSGAKKKTSEAVVYNDAVDEAERIIDKYMENLGYISRKGQGPKKIF